MDLELKNNRKIIYNAVFCLENIKIFIKKIKEKISDKEVFKKLRFYQKTLEIFLLTLNQLKGNNFYYHQIFKVFDVITNTKSIKKGHLTNSGSKLHLFCIENYIFKTIKKIKSKADKIQYER